MTAPELPDDPQLWPDDPFLILGVDPRGGFRDLRRAYAQRIRRFKPEHHPEQFRRIRAAYEFLEPLFKSREAEGEPSSAPAPAEPPGQEGPPAETPASVAAAEPPTESPPPPDPLAEVIEEAWSQLGSPEAAAGYQRLVELAVRHEDRDDLFLRLYWMLVFEPSLDAARHRCDWLVDGLQRGAPPLRLALVYHQELDREPAEALTERGNAYLATLLAPAELLPTLSRRWLAASRAGRWDVLTGDLERVRGRVEAADHRAWVRVLLLAVDYLAWATEARAQEALRRCREELDQQPDAHFTFDAEFSRYDLLLELAAGCRKLDRMDGLPAGLVDLLRRSWNERFEQVRPEVLAMVRRMVDAPADGLKLLDWLASESAAALHQVGHLIHALHREYNGLPIDHPRPDLQGEIREFLAELPSMSYHALRPKLMHFCLREMILVETFLHVATGLVNQGAGASEDFLRQASSDAPLHYLCRAVQAFWT